MKNMPFMRRNRRSKSRNRRKETVTEDFEDTRCLQGILKRVSVISSTMIKVISEIREELLKLFGRGGCISQQVASDNDPDGDSDGTRGNGGAGNRSFTYRLFHPRRRLVCARRRAGKNAAEDISPLCQEASEETYPENMDYRTDVVPSDTRVCNDENIQSNVAIYTQQPCSHTMEEHEEIVISTTRKIKPDHLTDVDRKRIARHVAPLMQNCVSVSDTGVRKIRLDSDIVKIVKREIMKKLGSKATFSEQEPVIQPNLKQNDGCELRRIHVIDRNPPTLKPRSIALPTQGKIVTNSTNAGEKRTNSTASGKTHTKKTKVSGLTQTTTTTSVSDVTPTRIDCDVTLTSTRNASGAIQKETNIVLDATQAEDEGADSCCQMPQGAEEEIKDRSLTVQGATCSDGQAKDALTADNRHFTDIPCPECQELNPEGVIARPSTEILLTEVTEISSNVKNLDVMLQTVIGCCVDAYLTRPGQFTMRLVAKGQPRPDGSNDWNPLFGDYLFSPGSKAGAPTDEEPRLVKFKRQVNLGTFTGTDAEIEQMLQAQRRVVVRTTLTDIRTNQPAVLGSMGELWWCQAALDLMTLVIYYTMIGCARTTRNTLAVTDSRQFQLNIKRNFRLKFHDEMRLLVERMRHGVEHFSVKNDVNSAGVVQNQGVAHSFPDCTAQPNAATNSLSDKPNKNKKHGRKKSRNTTQSHHYQSKSPAEPHSEITGAGEPEDLIKQQEDTFHENATAELGANELGIEVGRHVTSDVTKSMYEIAKVTDTTDSIADTHAAAFFQTDLGDDADSSSEHDNDAHRVIVSDVKQDFCYDYISYIETNNTLDYGALEVIAGHGEKPNKKKLYGEIREKKKTKGIPNKHLQAEQPRPTNEFYEYEFNSTDESEDNLEDTPKDESVAEGYYAADDQLEATKAPEAEGLEDLTQVLDDREYNLVPEEVLRKDESKLRDLEEAYTVGSAEKKKDKQKKRKERKNKPVKIQLVFGYQ